jgi:hypothetical protein
VTAIAARRKRRTWYALGAGVLVVAAIPVLGVAGWRAIRDSKAGRDVTTSAQTIPVTPTALLGATDAEGRLSSLALFALAPGGAGGSVVAVPVGSSITGDDGTRHRLADRFAEGGIDQLELDVEAVMLVTIDIAQVVDQAQLAALLAPVGDVTVNLPRDVVEGALPAPSTSVPVDEEAGTTSSTRPGRSTTTTSTEPETTTTTEPPGEVVAAAGDQQLTADALARVLLASAAGESETARLPVTETVWRAIAAAVGTGRPGATPVDIAAGPPADLTTFVGGLWAGTVRTWQMGVTPITSPIDNPTGSDLLQVDLAEAIMVVATVAPSAASAVLDGASVQLTSGFGDWRVTRNAIAVLAYIGANVMVVINTDEEPPAMSEVLSGSDAVQSLAEEYAKALGADAVEPVTDPVEGIEVQIVLGRSFADAQEGAEQTPLESVPSRDTVDENLATTAPDSSESSESTEEPEAPSAEESSGSTVES